MMVTGFVLAAALVSGSGDPPAVAPAPVATAKAPLREIGRAKAVTAFCRAFTQHFNGAVRPMLQGDGHVGEIGYTLGTLETHFDQRAGELAVYDDRVHLGAYVDGMVKLLPQAQAELNELRKSAALATDKAQADDAVAVAADLQRALDKQKQIAYDSQHVVQAMMDLDLGSAESTMASAGLPRALGFTSEEGSPRASTSYQTNVPGGFDSYKQSAPKNERDVRSYLHWQDQIDRIGDAESAAATGADRIASGC